MKHQKGVRIDVCMYARKRVIGVESYSNGMFLALLSLRLYRVINRKGHCVMALQGNLVEKSNTCQKQKLWKKVSWCSYSYMEVTQERQAGC